MQKHNPYILPIDTAEQERRIILSLESIADTIQDAEGETLDALAWSTVLPIETEELTTAIMTAREALKTAHNIAENLRTARHLDQR